MNAREPARMFCGGRTYVRSFATARNVVRADQDASGRWIGVATRARSKTEAKRFAADLERKTERSGTGSNPSPRHVTLPLASGAPRRAEEQDRGERHVAIETQRLGKHVLRSSLGALPLRLVTPAAIETRLREMERAGLGPASMNRLRTTVHTVYTRGRKAGLWTGAK